MNSDDGPVTFEVDGDSEDLAYILTVIASKLNPRINLGRTYEIYLCMILDLLETSENNPITAEDGRLYGQRILDTIGTDDGDSLH